MFLSAVWTIILMAPIHCRVPIGEQVIWSKMSPLTFSSELHLCMLTLSRFLSFVHYDSVEWRCVDSLCKHLQISEETQNWTSSSWPQDVAGALVNRWQCAEALWLWLGPADRQWGEEGKLFPLLEKDGVFGWLSETDLAWCPRLWRKSCWPSATGGSVCCQGAPLACPKSEWRASPARMCCDRRR